MNREQEKMALKIRIAKAKKGNKKKEQGILEDRLKRLVTEELETDRSAMTWKMGSARRASASMVELCEGHQKSVSKAGIMTNFVVCFLLGVYIYFMADDGTPSGLERGLEYWLTLIGLCGGAFILSTVLFCIVDKAKAKK